MLLETFSRISSGGVENLLFADVSANGGVGAVYTKMFIFPQQALILLS